MYGNSCDFFIDDNGILLDCTPGDLLLDENGIVQDGRNDCLELSSTFFQGGRGPTDQPGLSNTKSEKTHHQYTLEENTSFETRYCISDLEVSDEEKDFPEKLDDISLGIVLHNKNRFSLQPNNQSLSLKYRDSEISHPKYSLQHLKTSLDVSNDKFDNSFDEDPLAALLEKPKEPYKYKVDDNSDEDCNNDEELVENKEEFYVKNYFKDTESPSEMVHLSSSLNESMSSSPIVKEQWAAGNGMLRENRQNKSFCRESDEDDELFLITGHIDFGEQKPMKHIDFGEQKPLKHIDFDEEKPLKDIDFGELKPLNHINFGEKKPSEHIDFGEEKPLEHILLQESENQVSIYSRVSESGQRSDKNVSSQYSNRTSPELSSIGNSVNKDNCNHYFPSCNNSGEDSQISFSCNRKQITERNRFSLVTNPNSSFWNYSSIVGSPVSENRLHGLNDRLQVCLGDYTHNLDRDKDGINTTDSREESQFDDEGKDKDISSLLTVPRDENEINSTGRIQVDTFSVINVTNVKTGQMENAYQEMSNGNNGIKTDEISKEVKTSNKTTMSESVSNKCKRMSACGISENIENEINFTENKDVTLEEEEEEAVEEEEDGEVDIDFKPSSVENLKSSRTKSKSVTDISQHLTPVKPKHKSLTELNKLQIDEGSMENLSTFPSIVELNDKLVQESEKRKKATELVEELQNQYSNLLTRYASAALTIDEIRLGASSVPLTGSRSGSQTFVNSINFCRPLVTSTPLQSNFLTNQDSRNEIPVGSTKTVSHVNNQSKKLQRKGGKNGVETQDFLSKAESIKMVLLKEANNLEKMMNSLEALLQQNRLSNEDQKKFFEEIYTEQNKQRRQYLHIKEEFVINSAVSGAIVFDEDKELEGYLFDLQMRFDELEDKYQNPKDNLKEPFHSNDRPGSVNSLDGVEEEGEGVKEEGEGVKEDGIANESYEAKKEKFLAQYNVLMDKYWHLKSTGSFNDQEMKQITEKLREIKQELCQNEQQQQQQRREHIRHKTEMDSGVSVEMIKTKKLFRESGASLDTKPIKNEPNKNRVSRSLPEVPENKTGTRNKKYDDVSSTASVPDSGISDVWSLSLPLRQPMASLQLTKSTDMAEECPIRNPEVVSLSRTHHDSPIDTASLTRNNRTVPMDIVASVSRPDHRATPMSKSTLVRVDQCTPSTKQPILPKTGQQKQHVKTSSVVLTSGTQNHFVTDREESEPSFVMKERETGDEGGGEQGDEEIKEERGREEVREREEGFKLWQTQKIKPLSSASSNMAATSEFLSESSSSIESLDYGLSSETDPYCYSEKRTRTRSQSFSFSSVAAAAKLPRNFQLISSMKTRNVSSKKFSREGTHDGTKSAVEFHSRSPSKLHSRSPSRRHSRSHSLSQDSKGKDSVPTFIRPSNNRKKLEALQQEIEFLKQTFNNKVQQQNPQSEIAEEKNLNAANVQLLNKNPLFLATPAVSPQNQDPRILKQVNRSAKHPSRNWMSNNDIPPSYQATMTFFTDAVPQSNLTKYDFQRNSQMSSAPGPTIYCGSTEPGLVDQVKRQQSESAMKRMMNTSPNLQNDPYYPSAGAHHNVYNGPPQPLTRVQTTTLHNNSPRPFHDPYNKRIKLPTNHRNSTGAPMPMFDCYKENLKCGPHHWNPHVEMKDITPQRFENQQCNSTNEPHNFINESSNFTNEPCNFINGQHNSANRLRNFTNEPYSFTCPNEEVKYNLVSAPLTQNNCAVSHATQSAPNMYTVDRCCRKMSKCSHHYIYSTPIYQNQNNSAKADTSLNIMKPSVKADTSFNIMKPSVNCQLYEGRGGISWKSELWNPDLNASIDIATRTAKDINRLTKKMMKTMYSELRKTNMELDPYGIYSMDPQLLRKS